MKQSEKTPTVGRYVLVEFGSVLILLGGEVPRDFITYHTKVSEKSWNERRKRNTFAQ